MDKGKEELSVIKTFNWGKVWLKNGTEKPLQFFLVHKVGEFAWISETHRADMFPYKRKIVVPISDLFLDEVEAIRYQVEQCAELRKRESDALWHLNHLILGKEK